MNWYDTSWKYRKKITVDHTKVSSSLTNFPVYLDLSTLGTDFFSKVESSGGDIRITTSDGTTEVAIEVVAIDTGGNTGEVHFKAPSLSSTTDTVFYVYYGNASASAYSASATYGSQNVWDSNYKGVWHLSGNFNDSTANGYNLTATGSPGDTTGKLGNAKSFVATTKYASIANASSTGLNITGSLTIESWCYPTDLAGAWGHNYVLARRSGSPDSGYFINSSSGSFPVFYLSGISTVNYTGTHALTSSAWNFLVGVYDQTNSIVKLLVNTLKDQATSVTGTLVAATNPLDLALNSNNSAEGFDGNLDEIRISNIARSENWLTTQYNNQNSASTFYTIGSQETQGSSNFFAFL